MLEKKLKAGIIIEDTPSLMGFNERKLIRRISRYVSTGLDILVGPEWLFMPKEKLYSKSEKDSLVEEIANTTKDYNSLIMPGSIMWEDDSYFYNTAPVITKGKILGEYHKYFDGGSSTYAIDRGCKKLKYEKKQQGIYPWQDYKLGVEICADGGLLYCRLPEEERQSFDFYCLISSGSTLFKRHMPLKIGGYALNSNGADPYSIVVKKECWKENKNPRWVANMWDYEEIKPKKEFNKLHVYELNMGC